MIEMTKEQIEKIETLSFAKQKNMRVNVKDVTILYNELFAPRKVSVTTCATCIRRRIGEMENLLKKYKEEQEKLNKVEEQPTVETEPVVEQTQEEVVEEKEDVVEEQPEQEVEEEIKEENKKKPGRPKKEEQKDG